ncbi:MULTISPECIES: GH39 family glycosyl hydrolase [unclassified Paraburkholderia]|uniref:GH39 family glycosyl hydrolase n=1 Tax=unclassified Paraburkholderia TaxID=2615204 RepID=UPI002AB0D925|nr:MULTISPECIES: glycosyl hydrolase [unclassified Paraburkholderia]
MTKNNPGDNFGVFVGRRRAVKAIGAAALAALSPAALLSACGGGSLSSRTTMPAGYRAVTVDASQRGAAIRSLQGLDGPPVPAKVGASNVPTGATVSGKIDNPNGLDRTAQFKQMGVDFVRTHDLDAFGTGDVDGSGVNRLFPDWSADPTLPASYNFTALDTMIAGIVASGAEVFFRLGRSDLSMISVNNSNVPPADFDKFATIAQHIVMHYNHGWANGFSYGIRYWEIWNEPDFTPFWTGTAAQYYSLYQKVSAAIKSVDSTLKVGGPVTATHNDYRGMLKSFLNDVQANSLPLDFFSFHWYPQYVDPLDFYKLGVEYRALLNSYGMTSTELHLNEWNYSLFATPAEEAHAAFVATALVYMQEAPIDRACCYMRTQPLISDTGALTKGGSAMQAVGSLKSLLKLTTSGQDQQGFAVLAGGASDNKSVRVLISNYEIPAADLGPLPNGNDEVVPNVGTLTLLDRQSITYQSNAGYAVTVENLPWGSGACTVQQYRIDASNNLTLASTSKMTGSQITFTAALPAPRVDLLVITPA